MTKYFDDCPAKILKFQFNEFINGGCATSLSVISTISMCQTTEVKAAFVGMILDSTILDKLIEQLAEYLLNPKEANITKWTLQLLTSILSFDENLVVSQKIFKDKALFKSILNLLESCFEAINFETDDWESDIIHSIYFLF